MRMFHLRTLGLAILCSVVLTAADGPTHPTPQVWKPTSALLTGSGPVNLMPFANLKLAMVPLTDKRADKGLLGENQEKAKSRYVATTDDVAAFVSQHLLALFAEPGLPISAKTEGATAVLSGEILRFQVTEKETYQGEFRAILQIESAGKVLWKGLAVGQSTRFGRSYKLENYHETLSDCLVDAVAHLLADKAFVGALTGTPAVTTPAAAPAVTPAAN